MGLFSTGKTLASLWVDSKKRDLQGTGKPETKVDSGGSKDRDYFQSQQIDQTQLREIKEIRESGGVISHLVRAKALMTYGTGIEIETENEDLQEWITEHFPNLDNLVIDLGEDAIWFPSSYGELVETRSGDFSHLEPVEPWTILPVTNEYGDIVGWRQVTEGEHDGEFFQRDELVQFCINKSSARDKTGISEVVRAEEEITEYRQNQNAISNAVEMAAFPHNHWKIGADNMSTVTDNDLRRVRNIVDDLKSDTQIITGTDVEHDRIEPTKFDFTELTAHDLRKLAIALGVPMDLVAVGDHGLGAGEESKIRMQMFERQARADQRAFTDQFKSEVLDPVLRDYSPFSPESEDYDIVLGDPVEEDERTDIINAIGDDLRVNERRSIFDKPELEGEEGEQFQSPGEEQGDEGLGGGGGFFSEHAMRALEIPDNAQPIDDPSDCDGKVVEGPRGGTYCVPSGDDGGGESGGEGSEIPIEDVESGDEVVVDATIEGPDGDPIDISGDEVSVLDVDPNYGLLIEHPEHGRGEVPVGEINGITDPDADPGGDGESEPSDATIDGIDTNDTVNENETILSDDEKERVAERLANAHGEAGEQTHSWANQWRQNSISGAAESFASAVKEASGLDGDVRDSGRDAVEPSGEEVAAVEDMVSMSQEFFRERFGEETELVRGTRENARDDFLMSVFGGEESVEVNANAVDNYTSEEELAQNYAGDDGLVLRPTVSADDVQIANASLFAEGFESEGDEYLIDSPSEISADDAEVRVNGESISMASEPTGMSQEDFRALQGAMEDVGGELQSAFEDWAGDLA